MQPNRPQQSAPPGRTRDTAFASHGTTGSGPPVGRWLGIFVALLAIVVAKPWSGPGERAAPPHDATRLAAPPLIEAAAPEASVDSSSAGPSVASICLDPPNWRVATIERWHDQTIRVWRAIEPISGAAGPDDGRVPVMSLVSEGVFELGWCAPVVPPVGRTGVAAVDVWRRSAEGPSVPVRSAEPEESPYGALYDPPEAPRTALWKDGVYVFLHRAPGGHQSWFAVDLELRPSPGDAG